MQAELRTAQGALAEAERRYRAAESEIQRLSGRVRLEFFNCL